MRSSKFSYVPLFLILAFVLLLGVIQTVRQSLFFSSRNRISIAVLAPHAFVLSYDKKTSIANVIYFNTSAQVTVPGGYGWYSLNSVPLLEEIEHKGFVIARHTFEELVGAPIDAVIMPTHSDIIDESSDPFIEWFLTKRRSFLAPLSRQYKISTRNLIDWYFFRSILATRKDKLVFVDGSTGLVQTKKNGMRYSAEKLDLTVKGFLYWTYPSSDGAVNVYTTQELYSAGTRIGRIIEGAGMKVLDVETVEHTPDTCILIGASQHKNTFSSLARYFGCSIKLNESDPYSRGIIDFYIDTKIGTIYR
ncbi:MAG: hypothetical protein NUV65_02340 [Candidatus Roizmanbacteria bacterium]|nr:hypothetical protein [Candidatus Roizmanbacteria bacterium]